MAGVVDSWRCRSHFVGCRIFLLISVGAWRPLRLAEQDRRLLPPPIAGAFLPVTPFDSLTGGLRVRAQGRGLTGALRLPHSISRCARAVLVLLMGVDDGVYVLGTRRCWR